MKKELPTLKIRPLLPPPEKQKITFKLPVPTLESFQAYQALYKETYGIDPDPDFIADQIFMSFFESDKTFAAHQQRAVAKAEGPGGASAAKAEGAGGASLLSS